MPTQTQRELFFREFVISLISHAKPLEIAPVHFIPKQLPVPEFKQPPQQVQVQEFTMPVPTYTIPAAPLPLTQEINLPSLSKLAELLLDQYTISIECPGPDKQLLVNKNGNITTTNISLTKEEIDAIISDFSAKTHIPLIQGTFKAVYARLLITAVVSDFVGTRFIIQKRVPAH